RGRARHHRRERRRLSRHRRSRAGSRRRRGATRPRDGGDADHSRRDAGCRSVRERSGLLRAGLAAIILGRELPEAAADQAQERYRRLVRVPSLRRQRIAPEPSAVKPPVEPMLAKLADELPVGEYLYEPKWDGFRAIAFRGKDDVYLQSRDSRPLDRYFPELHDALLALLPGNCVVDGEIVIATSHGLDFDALQLRLHPAAS